LELLWAALKRNFDHLTNVFLSVGSEFSVNSLLFALTVAASFIVWRRLRRGRRLRLRALARALFPRRILRSPSTVADFGYFLFNMFVFGAIVSVVAVSYQFLTNGVLSGLVTLFGRPAPSTWPEWASRSAITVMLFLAYELGYWIDHYLKHRVPFLWEVHKVHHTAEVLTPLTTFRMHPLDTYVFGNILAIVAAIANGIGAYLFGDTTYQYALSGSNIILVVFIHAYVHLQHTHVWIAFRGLLGRIFLSPAHHQVHHSTNPIHFNKNLGSCLAIWDWLFGTLHLPSKTPEKLTFGVEPAQPNAHTITGEFIVPFGRALAALAAMLPSLPRRSSPLSAKPEQS
jgi:sterol desaturase/sphingolipid hydroxylase (fatty acid hydroxylase superfamily)